MGEEARSVASLRHLFESSGATDAATREAEDDHPGEGDLREDHVGHGLALVSHRGDEAGGISNNMSDMFARNACTRHWRTLGRMMQLHGTSRRSISDGGVSDLPWFVEGYTEQWAQGGDSTRSLFGNEAQGRLEHVQTVPNFVPCRATSAITRLIEQVRRCSFRRAWLLDCSVRRGIKWALCRLSCLIKRKSVFLCVCVSACACVFVLLCVCVHMYTYIDRSIDRSIDQSIHR